MDQIAHGLANGSCPLDTKEAHIFSGRYQEAMELMNWTFDDLTGKGEEDGNGGQ